jgi:hypothetical protein
MLSASGRSQVVLLWAIRDDFESSANKTPLGSVIEDPAIMSSFLVLVRGSEFLPGDLENGF